MPWVSMCFDPNAYLSQPGQCLCWYIGCWMAVIMLVRYNYYNIPNRAFGKGVDGGIYCLVGFTGVNQPDNVPFGRAAHCLRVWYCVCLLQMADWRSWLRSWTAGRWCTPSVAFGTPTPVSPSLSSSTGWETTARVNTPVRNCCEPVLIWFLLTSVCVCVCSDGRRREGCSERTVCKPCEHHEQLPEGKLSFIDSPKLMSITLFSYLLHTY